MASFSPPWTRAGVLSSPTTAALAVILSAGKATLVALAAGRDVREEQTFEGSKPREKVEKVTCLKAVTVLTFSALSPPHGRPEGTPSSEPRRLASLGSLLDDQHWHHVLMVWRSSELNLTVDQHTETVQVPAEFSRRSSLELKVGAMRDAQEASGSFGGCLENLLYNNLNLIELAKRRAPQVSTAVSTRWLHPEVTRDRCPH